MTTTNGTPVEETSVALKDATNWAQGITLAAINMYASELLTGEASALWEAAVPLCEAARYSVPDRRAILMQLDALLMQPEALVTVAQRTRDHLVRVELDEHDPRLRVLRAIDAALASRGVVTTETAPAHVPLAVNHTIDGLICELRPDGALDVSSTALGLVRMEPRDAYALAMFMRSPAAVALLEAQNAARMTKSELDFQADPETIAERAAHLKEAR